MRLFSLHLLLSFIVFLPTPTARADNWPQWRGAKLDGVSHETGLPTHWSPTENVAWRVPLPGPAGATPVVWGDRIFLTTVNQESLELHCISTSGKRLWTQTVGAGNRDVRGDEGNSASPSPSTDGRHVWTFMANGHLACYGIDGQEVWRFNVESRYGKLQNAFGMTSTPVLDGDRLYLQLIQGDQDASTKEAQLVALEKTTGREVWRVDRPSDCRQECEHSYASPIIYRDAERAYLIAHGGDYTTAHRLEDGQEIWRCGGLNPPGSYDPTFRFVATPVAVPGLIVVPTAKRGPVVAVSPKAQGTFDIADSDYVRWTYPTTPDVPSPLVYDGLVYLCRENGNLAVLDAETGEEYYQKRTVRDRHRASPVYLDGHVLLTGRRGKVTVVRAGRKFEIVAQNNLSEPISSSPVVAGGTIYLRTFEALYAIRK